MTNSIPDTSILWHNDTRDVFVVDIPHSIGLAQGLHEQGRLLSCPALESPYVQNEPKTARKRAKLAHNTLSSDVQDAYASLTQDALAQVKLNYTEEWCLSRVTATQSQEIGEKRARSEEDKALPDAPREPPLVEIASSLSSSATPSWRWLSNSTCNECEKDHGQILYSNCAHESSSFTIASQKSAVPPRNYDFYIPAQASFCLIDCSVGPSIRHSIKEHADAHNLSRKFDLVLLDPPWPNRSVKRTRRTSGGGYGTSASMHDVHSLIVNMDLDMMMTDDSWVGVWTTNRHAVRDLVLADGGLFDVWGVSPEEEWVWLKTTETGEPMVPVNSSWRKPYEVLLLGRRRRMSLSSSASDLVLRRVIIAVPDLHSRKPCLKELFDLLLHKPGLSRTMEVFARHLVTGWTSIGNECIKYNWQACWQKS